MYDSQAATLKCRSPVDFGIPDAIAELSGKNRVTANFYDGPGWAKFRKWERLFFWLVGGWVKARREILNHLPAGPKSRVFEVGIGNGENLDLRLSDWTIVGTDVARSLLAACMQRDPAVSGHLSWSKAESLPYSDGEYNACYSISGFNDFRDPIMAIAEMRRVRRPDGVVIVADVRPDLKNYRLGQRSQIEPADLLKAMSPAAVRHKTWRGLRDLLVDPQPSRSRS